jgi:hypothetical protein
MREQYNIAPEFCSATMDDIVTAKKVGSNCILKAKGTDHWILKLEFGGDQ